MSSTIFQTELEEDFYGQFPILRYIMDAKLGIRLDQGWKNLGFFEEVFFTGLVLGFRTQRRLGHKITTQEEHPIHHEESHVEWTT